jgi:large subunit ribosomal protein L17
MRRRRPQCPGQRGGSGRGGLPSLAAAMRHQKSGRHFNRDTDARKALMRNLCTSLLEHGRITTTEAKAKELRRWVDRLITEAKADDLAARRRVAREISSPDVADRLFTSVMPRLRERPGGYTRIIHKGPRLGDAAPMVVIELVDRPS